MNLTDKTLQYYKRINVLGSPGSGKSTFSRTLSKILGIKVYDLDDYLYDSKCKRLNADLSKQNIVKLLNNDSFIIDGTYTTTFSDRLSYLDLVIIVDRTTFNSFFTFSRRYLFKKNLKCGEKFTWKTLNLIFLFNSKTKHFLINKTLNAGVKLALYNRNNSELQWLN
jgi:adenylate kinase family enzyme